MLRVQRLAAIHRQFEGLEADSLCYERVHQVAPAELACLMAEVPRLPTQQVGIDLRKAYYDGATHVTAWKETLAARRAAELQQQVARYRSAVLASHASTLAPGAGSASSAASAAPSASARPAFSASLPRSNSGEGAGGGAGGGGGSRLG
eukprot:m.268511 g.268511  ORF g.268511 m.268511 type:complete len:149 (+) comp22810_c3_seq2:506-952(+)